MLPPTRPPVQRFSVVRERVSVAITDALGARDGQRSHMNGTRRLVFRSDDPGRAAMTMRISPGSDLLTVIFEFDIEAEEQQPLREGVERLIREVLSRQPGFLAAQLHVSRDQRKVLNYLQWESLEAFERFCGDEDEQRRIRPVIGPYGPKQRVYDVVFAAGTARSPCTERS